MGITHFGDNKILAAAPAASMPANNHLDEGMERGVEFVVIKLFLTKVYAQAGQGRPGEGSRTHLIGSKEGKRKVERAMMVSSDCEDTIGGAAICLKEQCH
jgi:hypothetical protein